MAKADQRFLKHEHLRKPDEFRKVYEKRCSSSDAWILVFAQLNGFGYSRIGFSVSRKVGNAVVRNRFRRIYREAFRLNKIEIPQGLDFIIIPRSPQEPKLESLGHSLVKLSKSLSHRLVKEEKNKCGGQDSN